MPLKMRVRHPFRSNDATSNNLLYCMLAQAETVIAIDIQWTSTCRWRYGLKHVPTDGHDLDQFDESGGIISRRFAVGRRSLATHRL